MAALKGHGVKPLTPRVDRFATVRRAVTIASLHLGMPDLSPDKTRIVFRNVEQIGPEGPGDDEILDLFVINVDGTHLRQLTDDVADEYQARWSPDGTKIVFDSVMGGGNWNIFEMKMESRSILAVGTLEMQQLGANRRRLRV